MICMLQASGLRALPGLPPLEPPGPPRNPDRGGSSLQRLLGYLPEAGYLSQIAGPVILSDVSV